MFRLVCWQIHVGQPPPAAPPYIHSLRGAQTINWLKWRQNRRLQANAPFIKWGGVEPHLSWFRRGSGQSWQAGTNQWQLSRLFRLKQWTIKQNRWLAWTKKIYGKRSPLSPFAKCTKYKEYETDITMLYVDMFVAVKMFWNENYLLTANDMLGTPAP